MAHKREDILAAATSLFARNSYAKVTVEQIALALGIVPGALYHYFRDKEELIYQCYLRGLGIYEREIEAAAEPGIDGLETVRRFIRGRLKPESPRMILFTDIDALPHEYSQAVHAKRWRNAERLADIIRSGIEDGSVASVDPRLTAVALISILDWMPFWFTEHDYYTRQHAIDGIDDIVTHGVYRRDLEIPDPPEPPDPTPFLDARAGLSKRAAKFDRMLSIAADNFNRKGAMGASLEGIAADAGITRAGIYYHFSDKEGLLLACLQRGLQSEIEIGRHVEEMALEPADCVVQTTRLLLMLHDTPCGPKTTYHNINYLTEEYRRSYVAEVLAGIKHDQDNYRKWIEMSRFRPIDIYFAQRIITGMGHWYPIWFRGGSEWTPMQVADHFTGIFLYGIKPRPTPAPVN